MARRTRSWFDDEKLFPHERIIRSSRAWMKTLQASRYWEGEIVLTTDRFFFLPQVENPLIGSAAYWLASVTSLTPAGRHEFQIGAGGSRTTFRVLGDHAPISDVLSNRAHVWIGEISALRPHARVPEMFAAPVPRRAAG
jgi:hypothetical protein